MTLLRSVRAWVLAAGLLGSVGAGGILVVAAPGAVAVVAGDVADDGTPHGDGGALDGAGAGTSERGDTLGLVGGGAGMLILMGIAGGAWRYHRDPRTAARGH